MRPWRRQTHSGRASRRSRRSRCRCRCRRGPCSWSCCCSGRTLLLSAPVADSSRLAVRTVLRLGDTLTTSSRCASACTWLARICTVSACTAVCTACTEPPMRSTWRRKSFISGSGESLTTMSCTCRTPRTSRAHLARAAARGVGLVVQVAGHLAMGLRRHGLGGRAARVQTHHRQHRGSERRAQRHAKAPAFDQHDERRKQARHDFPLPTAAKALRPPSAVPCRLCIAWRANHFSLFTAARGCNRREVTHFTRGVGTSGPRNVSCSTNSRVCGVAAVTELALRTCRYTARPAFDDGPDEPQEPCPCRIAWPCCRSTCCPNVR